MIILCLICPILICATFFRNITLAKNENCLYFPLQGTLWPKMESLGSLKTSRTTHPASHNIKLRNNAVKSSLTRQDTWGKQKNVTWPLADRTENKQAIFQFSGHSYVEHFHPSNLMFKIITLTQTVTHQGPHAGRDRGALTTPWGRGTNFTSKPPELDILHSKHCP